MRSQAELNEILAALNAHADGEPEGDLKYLINRVEGMVDGNPEPSDPEPSQPED